MHAQKKRSSGLPLLLPLLQKSGDWGRGAQNTERPLFSFSLAIFCQEGKDLWKLAMQMRTQRCIHVEEKEGEGVERNEILGGWRETALIKMRFHDFGGKQTLLLSALRLLNISQQGENNTTLKGTTHRRNPTSLERFFWRGKTKKK